MQVTFWHFYLLMILLFKWQVKALASYLIMQIWIEENQQSGLKQKSLSKIYRVYEGGKCTTASNEGRTHSCLDYANLCIFNICLNHIVTTPTQPQLNSKAGFDMKMTLDHQHPTPTTTTTQTQCHWYLSCSWPNFNQTLNVSFLGSTTTTTTWTTIITTTKQQ